MRYLSLLVALFLLPLSIQATNYKSNALGHRLEPESSMTGIGWELEEDDEGEFLYLDGNIVKSKRILDDGYVINDDGYEERVFLDRDGKILRRIIDNDGHKTEYNYFYDQKELTGYTYSENNKLVKKIDYISNGSKLLAVSGSERGYFLSEYYLYDNGQGPVKAFVSSDDVYETLPNGSLKEVRGDTAYYYNDLGRIEKEERADSNTSYFYDNDGALERVERISGEERLVEIYKDSEIAETYIYEKGSLTKKRRVLESGEIEEIRYISGEERYRMVFDSNGRRLLEVNAL